MIVLGIDPGIERTGFGIIEHIENYQKLLDFGCILTDKKYPLASRLNSISLDLKNLILQWRPDSAVLEEIYFSKNVKTAIKVSHARGVILEVLEDFRIPVHEFPPQKIKIAVTGQGNADKKQVQKMIRLLLNLKNEIKYDDASDALACAFAFPCLAYDQ